MNIERKRGFLRSSYDKDGDQTTIRGVVDGCADCDTCRFLMDECCLLFPELYRLYDREKMQGAAVEKDELRRLSELCTLCGLCPCPDIPMQVIHGKTERVRAEGMPLAIRLLADMQRFGRLGALAPRVFNRIFSVAPLCRLAKRVVGIDPQARQVHVHSADGNTRKIDYGKLLIATGAESARPPIEGLETPGVFFLRWMDDSFAVKRFMDQVKPRRAVVIGGGYIGLEMADALTHKGMGVILMEFASEVLTTLDPDLGGRIRAELQSKGVRVITGHAVKRIIREQGALLVHTASGEAETTDMVLVAAGARPSTELAQSAGIGLGAGDATLVDRYMATKTEDIWAAGDCVHTWHRILERHVYMPLGTTAHKQGRVAGENMLGGMREFQGSLGTQVVKVFDQVVARTGLRDRGAIEAGFDPLTVGLTVWDHKAYFPGAKEVHVRITGDRHSTRLLGAQIVGHRAAEVSKRVDIFATALFHGMGVAELCDLDLSYTPPLSSPWDPVQMAAMKWFVALKEKDVIIKDD